MCVISLSWCSLLLHLATVVVIVVRLGALPLLRRPSLLHLVGLGRLELLKVLKRVRLRAPRTPLRRRRLLLLLVVGLDVLELRLRLAAERVLSLRLAARGRQHLVVRE